MQLEKQTQWYWNRIWDGAPDPGRISPTGVNLYKMPEEKMRQSGAESSGQLAEEQSVKERAGHASFS